MINENSLSIGAADSESVRRLFLACWPDQSLQGILDDLAGHLQLKHGGRKTEKENIHLTLVFLGQVQLSNERQLRQKLRTLDIKQFDLEIDKTGSFTHCRINWVGPRVVPNGLSDLQNVLKLISEELGFQRDDLAYQPHISLLHKPQAEFDFDIKPISWNIDHYCLIESKANKGGVEYEVIEEFPLRKH